MGPPTASGSLSVGGIAILVYLPLAIADWEAGMAPVTSPVEVGAGLICGIAAEALASALSGMKLLKDCRPIGVGEVIDGGGVWAGIAGSAPSSPARGEGCCSLELSAAGTGGGLP